MKEKNNLIRFPKKDRVTLEPGLAKYQNLSTERILAIANLFFRWAKQLYKLHDIRREDDLWKD